MRNVNPYAKNGAQIVTPVEAQRELGRKMAMQRALRRAPLMPARRAARPRAAKTPTAISGASAAWAWPKQTTRTLSSRVLAGKAKMAKRESWSMKSKKRGWVDIGVLL
jgi:hypothetical protein